MFGTMLFNSSLSAIDDISMDESVLSIFLMTQGSYDLISYSEDLKFCRDCFDGIL